MSYHFSSEELIRSCPLPKSCYSHKPTSYKSLTVEASKIEPLSSFLKITKKHLEYADVERLIEMIGRQLHNLEVEQNKGISLFHLDDITVFHLSARTSSKREDDTPAHAAATTTTAYFAITNDEYIHDIDHDNHMEINTIPTPTPTLSALTSYHHHGRNIAFYSPEYKEFMSKKTIPFSIHFKSSYYSFGLLCAYCYVRREAPHADAHADTDADTDFDAHFSSIINTKIYWFLKHVLRTTPSERRYICV
jgi:hypothetical protein